MDIPRLFHCRLPADSKGSILILAFWALSLLSLFAIYMGQGVRQKLALMDRLIGRSQLYGAAQAGARRGEAELRKPDTDAAIDSLKEPWAQAQSMYKDVKVGEGAFSLNIIDEERKVNINTAGLDVLKRLFKEVSSVDDAMSEEIASAIIDWRDADSASLALGAENNYYSTLKYPYSCKDARFDILDELLLVRGVTVTIYNSVKDHLTIYGQGQVNVNTAPNEVLMALGLDKKLADKILLFRSGKDGVEETEDDNVFAGSASIVPQLSQFTPLSPEELTILSQFASSGLVNAVSEYFTVFAQAGYGYKKGTQSVTCVFQRFPLEAGGYGTEVKYWRIAQ
jgi:type II secretory pathway component PulK